MLATDVTDNEIGGIVAPLRFFSAEGDGTLVGGCALTIDGHRAHAGR